MHKTRKQIKILKQIQSKSGGKSMNLKARRDAIEKTGLKWIKIYKWFFDKKVKEKSPCEANCSGC